ncbi:MAG: hypothetical protein KIS76_01620 [Pyrinomonadaceae bacterium]|nr:hypothetical protein [Pyrinomonadaceae bacterium]
MKRSVLSTLVFALTFGSSVLLVGLIFGFPSFTGKLFFTNSLSAEERVAVRIERLLERDRRNAIVRDMRILRLERSLDRTATPADYAGIIDLYATDIERIDSKRVPHEFRSSWKAHVKAWREYSLFLNSVNASYDFESVYSRENDRLSGEIERTWYETLKVGRLHGSKFVD